MLTIVISTILSATACAVLAWGSTIRDTMAREGMDHGAGLMPAGAAMEVD